MKQKHRDECAKKTVSANDSDSDMGLESLKQPQTLIISKVILKKKYTRLDSRHPRKQLISFSKKEKQVKRNWIYFLLDIILGPKCNIKNFKNILGFKFLLITGL